MDVVNDLIAVEMSVYAEFSLVHGAVPEWGGVEIERGLYFNASVSASAFFGFTFDFNCSGELRLPEALLPPYDLSDVPVMLSVASNPMGILTGQVPLAGFKVGVEVNGSTTLHIPGLVEAEAWFFGKITVNYFNFSGEVDFELGGGLFTFHAYLEFFAQALPTPTVRLEAGGEIDFGAGALGKVSIFGTVSEVCVSRPRAANSSLASEALPLPAHL